MQAQPGRHAVSLHYYLRRGFRCSPAGDPRAPRFPTRYNLWRDSCDTKLFALSVSSTYVPSISINRHVEYEYRWPSTHVKLSNQPDTRPRDSSGFGDSDNQQKGSRVQEAREAKFTRWLYPGMACQWTDSVRCAVLSTVALCECLMMLRSSLMIHFCSFHTVVVTRGEVGRSHSAFLRRACRHAIV